MKKNKRARVKKGQLRKWEIKESPFNEEMFVTVSAKVSRDGVREGLGWSNYNRGEIFWTIMESGGELTGDVSQTLIFNYSRAIDEAG